MNSIGYAFLRFSFSQPRMLILGPERKSSSAIQLRGKATLLVVVFSPSESFPPRGSVTALAEITKQNDTFAPNLTHLGQGTRFANHRWQHRRDSVHFATPYTLLYQPELKVSRNPRISSKTLVWYSSAVGLCT